MRKYYIDNLRIIIFFLLFPVHTFMIWNDFGFKFYIWDDGIRLLSTMIVVVNPWFMPMLFVFAGISARYVLNKRTKKEFIWERITKLLIPFILGIIFLVPIQTFYARKFFMDCSDSYLENFKFFFTHITDMSGYDGAFTPGHLWFILFLFIISMISLLLFHFLPYEKVENKISKMGIGMVVAMFIPIYIMYYLGNFGGFSIGKSFALYLLGYYVLCNEAVILTLEKNMQLIISIFSLAEVILVVTYYKFAYYGDLLVHLVAWTGILVFMVIGKKYLNKNTVFTKYFSKASFPIYILHQSILVALAYYVLMYVSNLLLRILIIMIGSFLLSVLAYELIKRIPFVRGIIGIGEQYVQTANKIK